MTTDIVDAIVQAARGRHVLEMVYRKHVTKYMADPRYVEPYNFTQGKQDMMVRCYQIAPKEGWRFFMIHKIESVQATPQTYHPRVKITLPTGDVDVRYREEPIEVWTEDAQIYRDMTSDALADATFSKEEFNQIIAFRRSSKLTNEQVQYIHYSLYHRCLGAILDDGHVDQPERLQIRFLHRVLDRLGWAIGD